MQLLDDDGNKITKKRELPSFVDGRLVAVTRDGDREIEAEITADINKAIESQKKSAQTEAKGVDT